jgi:uncharacterized protein
MAVNATVRTSVAAGSRPRLPGPDVVRAVALIGVVVMNYHGYLILRGGPRDESVVAELFDPWAGPLSTRFAATFVLVAGVGVTLMTRRSLSDRDRIREMRWRLVRRGALLYIGGLFLDEIWPGTIIPFYGGMFVIAAVLFTLRSRWLIALGTLATLAAWSIRTWRFWRAEDGESTAWLTTQRTGTARGYVLDLFVNGTHPLLPWLAFLCAGMVLGRILGAAWWRPATIAVGFTLYSFATIVGSTATTSFQLTLLSTDPFERGLVYVASALGTALIAYASIDWLAERFTTALDPLRRAGQMTLTLYIAHVLVFNFVVDWMGWIEPAGLDVALAFALVYWVAAIAIATWWSRRFGRGPAERIYRAIGG